MTGSVVMLLTNDFVSDPRVEKEALALSSAGWDVTVLAWDRSQSHERLEQRGPIRIERLGPGAAYGGGVRSIGNFREFWRRSAARAAEIAPDVIHCHDLDTAPAGLSAMSDLRGPGKSPKLVLDFHELYRESRMVPQAGIAGMVARFFVRALERRAISAAHAVLIANPGTAACYDDYRVHGKIVLVENAPDIARFTPSGGVADPSRFTICYIGQKRYFRNLEMLMRAVQADGRLHARLCGGGVVEAQVQEAARNYLRVSVSGPFTYDEVPGLYSGCDAVYAVYDSSVGNIQTAVPVKALEGMAAGLPVITNRGTWFGQLLVEHRAGMVVDGNDEEEITDAILTLANDRDEATAMGRRGRALVEADLNWEAASGRLIEAYRSLAS